MANLAGPVLSSLLGEAADPLYEDGFDGETDTLGERDEFLPALIPFAAPLIGRGITAVGSLLSRNPRTRSLLHALPKVVAETAYDMRRLGRPTSRDVRRRWHGARPASSAIRPRCRRRCGRIGPSPRAPRRNGHVHGSHGNGRRRARESGRHAPLWHLLRPARAG